MLTTLHKRLSDEYPSMTAKMVEMTGVEPVSIIDILTSVYNHIKSLLSSYRLAVCRNSDRVYHLLYTS
jgi:hypothetical protein